MLCTDVGMDRWKHLMPQGPFHDDNNSVVQISLLKEWTSQDVNSASL